MKPHKIDDFECSIKDLNEFLIQESPHQMNNKLNVTFVCLYGWTVVAYFTQCTDSIRVKDLKDRHKQNLEELDINYDDLPALKLCRLAVDKNYFGNKIGHKLVELIIKNALALSGKVGLRYITVNDYCLTKWLYDKYEFELFPKENRKLIKYKRNPRPDHTVSMYMDIHEN